MIRFALTLAGVAAALCACNTRLDAPLSDNFGQAVASMDSQIVPAVVSDAPPEGSGAQAAGAIRRYETDRIKKPAVAATSALVVNTGGGGGDSGASSASTSSSSGASQ